MTDPNQTSPAVMQGWESLKQRTTTFIVLSLLALSTLLTPAGRERLGAWGGLALEALSPRQMNSVYTILPTDLTVEQLVGVSFETAGTYRIDPYLLLAVISIESAFNPLAESPVGAVGLMQIMPKVHSAKIRSFGGQPLDPWVNLQVGASILREYIDRFGSEMEALKAYVGSLGQPTDYPARVMRDRDRMIAAAAGRVLP